MRKTLSAILSVIMILSVLSGGLVSVSAADGTAVSTAEEFANMKPDGKYYLAADITLTASFGEFSGTFDGNGKTVTTSVPVFAKVTGTVKNLTVAGEINGTDTVAALAVEADGATIEKVTNKANVNTSKGHAAGIVALLNGNASTVAGCTNKGKITNSSSTVHDSVAGIVCKIYAASSVVDGCVNEGDVTVAKTADGGNGNAAAGIVARTDFNNNAINITIKNCTNKGKIYGHHWTGGICGLIDLTTTITGCVNYGDIESRNSIAGGIAGRLSSGEKVASPENIVFTLKNCTNYGSVIGRDDETGGIVGWVKRVIYIEYCFNYGNISSPNKGAAGVVGHIGADSRAPADNHKISSVKYCGNEGTITGTSGNIGGVVGYVAAKNDENDKIYADISYCYNFGEVNSTKKANASGILGYTKSQYLQISNCLSGGKAATGEGGKTFAVYVNKFKPVDGSIKNNTIVEGVAEFVSSEDTAVTDITDTVAAAAVGSGELAYNLNKVFGKNFFRQTLGTDAHPTTKSGSKVVDLVDGKYVNTTATPDKPTPADPNPPTGDSALYIAVAALAAVSVLGVALIPRKHNIAG